MDIKMRDNSAGYSTAIGIRSSLASAFYGSITSTGDITAYSSDMRLKENIVKIENAVDKVSQINGVYFSWKPKAEELGLKIARPDEVGVLAQEIQKVLPEAVYLAPFDQSDEDPLVSKSGEHYLTVKYEKIVPLLIEAIKELTQRIEDLERDR
jgi:trimeric autotransporter adhesin